MPPISPKGGSEGELAQHPEKTLRRRLRVDLAEGSISNPIPDVARDVVDDGANAHSLEHLGKVVALEIREEQKPEERVLPATESEHSLGEGAEELAIVPSPAPGPWKGDSLRCGRSAARSRRDRGRAWSRRA